VWSKGDIEVEVNLRPTVGRPVCLGVRRPSGTRDQFFFVLEISFRQLRVCYFVVPSLTRGRVCNLLYNCFWVLSEQSLFGWSSAELTAIFYCLIWDSPSLEGQVAVFISPRNRVAQLYPWALGSLFVASYDMVILSVRLYGRNVIPLWKCNGAGVIHVCGTSLFFPVGSLYGHVLGTSRWPDSSIHCDLPVCFSVCSVVFCSRSSEISSGPGLYGLSVVDSLLEQPS
jgi:hypothetical protein